MRPLLALLQAALLLALPLSAAAERLRVDVLLFQHPPSAEERGTAPRHPDDERAIALVDPRGLALAGIALLPETSSTLAAEWTTLRRSPRYKALQRLSWLQDTPPPEGGPALRIYLPGGDGISGVSGWLRLHGGAVTALSADLETVQASATREPLGLRLQQRQSLTPGTTHYFDSAGLGLLVRVTPAR